jgi:hypothetical protein
MVYVAQIQHRESQKQLMNGHRPLYFLAEVIPQSILIQLYYWVINRGRYTDGFYNCMIDDKDSHLHLPLIMFTCTVSRHAVLVRHKIKGVPPKASMAKLKVDRPDRSNYLNYENDSGKNAHCRTATGRKLLTTSGVADTYTLLKNTWNTLPESYQQHQQNVNRS